MVVCPTSRARIGDDVLIILKSPEPKRQEVCIVRELVKRTEPTVTLRQHNPPQETTIEISKVKNVCRLLTVKDLFG